MTTDCTILCPEQYILFATVRIIAYGQVTKLHSTCATVRIIQTYVYQSRGLLLETTIGEHNPFELLHRSAYPLDTIDIHELLFNTYPEGLL